MVVDDTRQREREVQRPDAQLGVLLLCFDGRAAATARRSLETRLRDAGDRVLDSVVLQVTAAHHVALYDPRRVVAGALTAALTWGLFAVVTGGGVRDLLIWGLIGAVYGGVLAYRTGHALPTVTLRRLGALLRAPSSALLTFAETHDLPHLLPTAAGAQPLVASVAVIAADLTSQVVTAAADSTGGAAGTPEQAADGAPPPLASMLLLRYPDPATATQVAARLAAADAPAGTALQVELIIATDRTGRRHVADPGHGVAAVARSEVVTYAVLGLLCGAIVGATAGGGLLGFLTAPVLLGLAWGPFGLTTGALYGLWAGRATSARRLRGIAPLLAWVDGPVTAATIQTLSTPDAQHLVLSFLPVTGGAVLALPEPGGYGL